MKVTVFRDGTYLPTSNMHLPSVRHESTENAQMYSTAPPSLNLGTRWRWMVNLPLYSRARTPVPTKQEAGLVPEPVSTLSRTEKSFNRVGNRTLDRPANSLFTIMSYQRTDSVSKSAMTLKERNIGHSSGLTVLRSPSRQERRQNIWFWPWPLPSISFPIHNSPTTLY